MKVTEEGTTHIIKWYQPATAEECKSTDCMKCVYQSYIPSSSSCPFEAWMINHPVKKPTGTDKQPVRAKRYQRYRIERVVVNANDARDSNITIPDNAIMMKHAIITPSRFSFERDLIHVITWLEPIE